MTDKKQSVVEEARELLAKIVGRDWRAECSAQRGHTVWGALDHAGSMQVAATGHAEFDGHNANFAAAAPRLVGELVKRTERIEAFLRGALCPGCKYSLGFKPATKVSADWPNCDVCRDARALLADHQEKQDGGDL